MAIRIEEGTHRLDDGVELYTKTWIPTQDLKARLLFLHGFSDHCNNYEKFLPYLAERGIHVHAADQRGWGRSVPSSHYRGRTGPTSLVMADITSLLNAVFAANSTSPVPVYLMGHSMGGAEALYYATFGPTHLISRLRGIIASAPLIALHPQIEPWKTTKSLSRIAEKIMPHFHVVNHIDSSLMSHDTAANEAWSKDPLNHDTGTLEGLVGMFDRSETLDSRRFGFPDTINEGGRTRLLVAHGTDDHINSFEATKAFMKRCKGGDVSFEPWQGRRHCMHLDTGYDEYRSAVADWILKRCDLSAEPETPNLSSTSRL